MNINKSKILLDKINVLMRSMSIAPEQIAEIEKDLMKSYVQQLYDAILSETDAVSKTSITKSSEPQIVEKVEKPKPVSIPAPPKPAPAPPVQTVRPTPAPVPKVEPPVEKPKPQPAPKPKIAPPVEFEVEAPTPEPAKPQPKPVPKKQPASTVVDEELEEIFDLPNATDLSEKLSQAPIKDLTKAFSINEKLFTIKELFSGDDTLFRQTLQHLNSLDSFEDAKSFLATGVAAKVGWAKRSKKKKAKEFVKTVKRRYS